MNTQDNKQMEAEREAARQEVERAVGTHIEQMQAQLAGEKLACDALLAAQAGSELAEDAARWRHVRDTTTAIRNAETGEREPCTPEQFTAAVDKGRAALAKKSGGES